MLEDLAWAKGVAPVVRQPRIAAGAARADIVEAILDGRQLAELQLGDLPVGFPLKWVLQWRELVT
jgi:hypothetical protein